MQDKTIFIISDKLTDSCSQRRQTVWGPRLRKYRRVQQVAHAYLDLMSYRAKVSRQRRTLEGELG